MKNLVKAYFKDYDTLKGVSEKCLNTERWNGNVVLMVLDTAITSVGVNYFQIVLPKVKAFEKEFVRTGKITSLESFSRFNFEEAFHIWKNRRSWDVVKEISSYLSTLSEDDREALRQWAKKSKLKDWKQDPIGKIKGVGLITYQYLRMMGGVDTVMPDKIVKKVINSILIKAGFEPINDDMEFIKKVESLAKKIGYRPIELCLMTWFFENPERILKFP